MEAPPHFRDSSSLLAAANGIKAKDSSIIEVGAEAIAEGKGEEKNKSKAKKGSGLVGV